MIRTLLATVPVVFLVGCQSVYGPVEIGDGIYYAAGKKDVPKVRIAAYEKCAEFCKEKGGKMVLLPIDYEKPSSVGADITQRIVNGVTGRRRALEVLFKCEPSSDVTSQSASR